MHSVTIGDVEITALLDSGLLMNPRQFLPAHADAFLAEWAQQVDARGLLPMAVTCYLVRSAGKNILVDTGLGSRRRPGFPVGHLDESLQGAGLAPSDIDIVVHTHMHIDHVGWNTVDAEDGSRRVFFPRARFLFQTAEWEHWMQPKFLSEPSNAHLVECVEPLQAAGCAELVDAEYAVDEHISFLATPGHTPGHVSIGTFSAGERAVIVGDASHHPVQLTHPDWSPPFDSDPELAGRTRDALFDRSIAEGRTWLAGHWEHPGMGRIVRLDGRRVFKAL